MQPIQNDPVHLTATALLKANSQQGVNAVSLKNPTGQPMELLEVKWLLGTAGDVHVNGGSVGCKMDLGSIPLTNGFVPVWNFGPATKLVNELTPTIAVAQKQWIGYQWKLQRPLFVPAGAVVTPVFQHRGQVPQDIDLRVSYSCRSLPMGYRPKGAIAVPYVAAWVSKVFEDFSATVDTDQSRETDLINRFNEPLNVHRFIGRFSTFDAGVVTNTELFELFASRLIQLRMVDSKGDPIVPRFSFFRQVFSSVTRSWEVDFQVDPQAFFLAFLQRLITADDPNNLGQAFVSMVGTREIKGGA